MVLSHSFRDFDWAFLKLRNLFGTLLGFIQLFEIPEQSFSSFLDLLISGSFDVRFFSYCIARTDGNFTRSLKILSLDFFVLAC